MMIRKLRLFVILLALWAFVPVFSAQAQTTPATVKVESANVAAVREFKLDSKLMARAMPYKVILPDGYDAEPNKSKGYAVVYLLHGLTGNYNNWTGLSKLPEHAFRHQYIIVTPEGANGWYTDSVSAANDKYESYIMQELVPEIDAKFRTLANRENRVIGGLSMGGYGALKFGLKYPDKFVVAGSFSGALGAASWSVKSLGNNWKALTDSIAGVYGEDDSPTRAQNDIYRIVREITPEKIKTLPFLYVDCGTEDFLIQQNRDFAALLTEKKIPHEYRQLPGKHDWQYWDSQVQEFLRLTQKFVK